jgi:hypothetical protein
MTGEPTSYHQLAQGRELRRELRGLLFRRVLDFRNVLNFGFLRFLGFRVLD